MISRNGASLVQLLGNESNHLGVIVLYHGNKLLLGTQLLPQVIKSQLFLVHVNRFVYSIILEVWILHQRVVQVRSLNHACRATFFIRPEEWGLTSTARCFGEVYFFNKDKVVILQIWVNDHFFIVLVSDSLVKRVFYFVLTVILWENSLNFFILLIWNYIFLKVGVHHWLITLLHVDFVV